MLDQWSHRILFYPIVDSHSFPFPPCRSGKPLLVSWAILYMVTVMGSGVYITGATMSSSVSLKVVPSGLLSVDNLSVSFKLN